MTAPAPAVRVRGLWKRFGFRDALAGVSLEVAPGECVAVLGRNGSGKTTLVRILATLSLASEGDVEIGGHALPAGAAGVRSSIGVVLDHPMMPRELTLSEGLRFQADLFGVRDPVPRIEFLAARFGLGPRLGDPLKTFSRGMTQRASLLRALLHEPKVLLLDEPTVALDPDGCRVLAAAVRDFCAAGGAVLLVSHDLPRVVEMAGRALLLTAGKVEAEGDVREVAARANGLGDAGIGASPGKARP